MSYVITGGQGALARQLIEWYSKQGATHLVLISRRPATSETMALIREYKQKGCHIDCIPLNVADDINLNKLFDTFGKDRPPLKGIIHAAGIIDDGLIMYQSLERFTVVYEPKIQGTLNLHQASLAHDLDHFVLFSSMSSMIGTPGQVNYAAANAFMDSFHQHRAKQKLPVITINWGPWADVGMAKDTVTRAEGLQKFTPEEGMKIFDRLMHLKQSMQLLVANIDWEKAFSHHLLNIPFLENVKKSKNKQLSHIKSRFTPLDIDHLLALPHEEMKTLLIKELQIPFQTILKLEKPIPAKQNFFELGMDSLMAIELRNNLQHMLGNQVNLSQTVLFEISTLELFTEHVMTLLRSPSEKATSDDLLNEEDRLLANLDNLSETDIDKLLAETLNSEILQ